jgi:hypothetical protein
LAPSHKPAAVPITPSSTHHQVKSSPRQGVIRWASKRR